jgi:hypothetical protein
MRVAKAVVKLIQSPREKKAIGSASLFLKVSYALFPGLSRNITAGVMRTYLKNAIDAEETPGNVLNTVEYGTSIGGGWEPLFQSNHRTQRRLAGSRLSRCWLTRMETKIATADACLIR